MNAYVEKLRSIYSFDKPHSRAVTVPLWRTGQVERIIGFFSNKEKQRAFGTFDVGLRKDMAELLRVDARSSLFYAHAADLKAMADALDGPPN
jgi:hypothetical protein